MQDIITHDKTVQRLIAWANNKECIRAVVLTSSRTYPGAPLDALSDYDVIMVSTDILPFYESRAYLSDFGPVLVVYHNPMGQHDGFDWFADITQYENGLKLDISFVCPDWLRWLAQQETLPPDIDLGYIILLDKDNLSAGIKPPTHKAYIPKPPSETEYLNRVEEFFHEATYVAKHLWRNHVMAAKHQLEYYMRFDNLRPMLEWRVEVDYGWAIKLGSYARGLEQRLRPELWAEVQTTYVGAGVEENWDAMFKMIALFRKVAIEVGQALGYTYPADLDRCAVAYLEKIHTLDHDAPVVPW